METLWKRSSNKTPGLPAPSTAEIAYRRASEKLRPKWVFYAIVAYIGVAMILRFFYIVASWVRYLRLRGAPATSPESDRSHTNNQVSLSRIPAAFVSAFRTIAYRWHVPFGDWHHMNGLTLFTAVAYMTILFTFSFSNAPRHDPNLWANRASHVACLQLTFIIALSGKNNVISILTGVSYEKLNIIHRIAARSVMVVAWAHGFGRIRIRLVGPDSLADVTHVLGLVSGIAYLLLFFLSLRPVRKWAYDLFLPLHILLVLVTIIAAYYHSANFIYYFWSAFVMWFFDRLCRFLFIAFNNRIWLLLFSQKTKSVKAEAELFDDGAVRLTLYRHMWWRPGHHVYVMIPAVSRWLLESHPFSIVSHMREQQSESPDGRRLELVIRPQNGMTRRLADHLQAGVPKELTVLVEGPYGSPPSVLSFKTVVLIAGGTGASYTLSYLLDVIHNVRNNNCVTRRVLFVWAVKSRSNIEWYGNVLQKALASAPKGLQVDIKIFVTRAEEELEKASKGSVDGEPEKTMMDLPFALTPGRPDIAQIIADEVTSTAEEVSVGVSGPMQMATTARTALTKFGFGNILRGTAAVDAHFEIFTNT